MGDHEITKLQRFEVDAIWYRLQRVLRTAFTTILTGLPIVPQIVQIVQGQWPAASGLTAVAVQAVAINAALTAVIAIPSVNRWLTVIGFGSVPRAVAKETAAANSPELQPARFKPSGTDYRTEQGDPSPTDGADS